MKVIHICLSCFYIDNYSYQENELVKAHVKKGFDVEVLASTESYDENGNRCYIEPSTYMGKDGAVVTRLAYSKLLPHSVMKKLRFYPGVYQFLKTKRPDIIVFHGLCAGAMLSVVRYKRQYPNVTVYADSHEDANNSATNFLSKNILHKIFYKAIILYSLEFIEKVLCISFETIEFCKTMYDVPECKIEFFPLGGYVYNDCDYERRRITGRNLCGSTDDDVVFLQTGKFGKKKKLIESLEAFGTTTDSNFKYVIAGVIDESIRDKVMDLITKDERIKFLGWQSGDALQNLLCAADVYVQPGSQSATMQMSICSRCPVVLDDVLSHQAFMDNNGWLVKDQQDLVRVFQDIEFNKNILKPMSVSSKKIGSNLLDYRKLADRLLV